MGRIFATFLLFFALVAGFSYALKTFLLPFIQEQQRKNPDGQKLSGRMSILLIGEDSLDGSKTDGFNPVADTIMVLSLDPKQKSAFLLSIPKDTLESQEKSPAERLDLAMLYQSKGADDLLKEVEKQLRMKLDHYVTVNYQSIEAIVNGMGGVHMTIPMDMFYEDNAANPPLRIDLKQGEQTLDGAQANQLLRFKSGYGNQEGQRFAMQQDFLVQLAAQLVQKSKAEPDLEFAKTLFQEVATDMSVVSALSIIKTLQQIDLENADKGVLPGAWVNNDYMINVDEWENVLNTYTNGDYRQMLESMRIAKEKEELTKEQDKILNRGESETNGNRAYSEALARTQLDETRVKIYNGSVVPKITQRAADLFKINDVTITDLGNYSNFDQESTVIYYTDYEDLAYFLRDILGIGEVIHGPNPTKETFFKVSIVIGKDFGN